MSRDTAGTGIDEELKRALVLEEESRRKRIMDSRLNDERAIIFCNLLNGVPLPQVARDFHKGTEGEVMQIFNFILSKIKSYCFERKLPPVLGTSISEVRQHKLACLGVLPKINLDKDPTFSKILEEKMSVRRDGTFTHQNVLKEMRA